LARGILSQDQHWMSVMREFFISGFAVIGRNFLLGTNANQETRASRLQLATKTRAIKIKLLAVVAAAAAMIVVHPFEAKAGGYYYGGYYPPASYRPYGYGYDGYDYGYGYDYAAFTWPFFWAVPPDDYCHQRVRIYDNWGGWVWGQRIVC
jgi:hypothetical protein